MSSVRLTDRGWRCLSIAVVLAILILMGVAGSIEGNV